MLRLTRITTPEMTRLVVSGRIGAEQLSEFREFVEAAR
jgi:hypothetical protein